MLTPAASDPNRKSELKRKEKDPGSFGAGKIPELPKGWKANELKSVRAQEDAYIKSKK